MKGSMDQVHRYGPWIGYPCPSQSHKLQKLKLHLWTKKTRFALNGQNNFWSCFFFREKRMFCSIKASLESDVQLCFVGFLWQMKMNTCQINGCLSCIPFLWLSVVSSVRALFVNWLSPKIFVFKELHTWIWKQFIRDWFSHILSIVLLCGTPAVNYWKISCKISVTCC